MSNLDKHPMIQGWMDWDLVLTEYRVLAFVIDHPDLTAYPQGVEGITCSPPVLPVPESQSVFDEALANVFFDGYAVSPPVLPTPAQKTSYSKDVYTSPVHDRLTIEYYGSDGCESGEECSCDRGLYVDIFGVSGGNEETPDGITVSPPVLPSPG